VAAKRIGLGHITARVLAASVGAYGLCYVWIVALVLLLPRVTALDGVDATIVSTCGSFVVFVVIISYRACSRSETVAHRASDGSGACASAGLEGCGG
jgi:hypothetical protein